MSQTALFWPAFVQVLLTVFVMMMMGRARSASMKGRKQSLDDVALNRPTDWDDASTKASNNFKNQFELPVLFFAGIGIALALKLVDPVLVALAWVFVLARVLQTAIHLGPNKVGPRGLAYLVGAVALLALWVLLALRVASS
jgi:hypothetical protein